MAWTAPITWYDGDPLTAAQLNLFVRDNFLASEAGVATTASRMIVTDDLNSVSERQWAKHYMSAQLDVTDEFPTTEEDIGPVVSVKHNGFLLIMFDTRLHMSSGTGTAVYAPMVNGSLIDTEQAGAYGTDVGPYVTFIRNSSADIIRMGGSAVWEGEPGIAKVSMAYGTQHSGGNAQYIQRRLTVIPF